MELVQAALAEGVDRTALAALIARTRADVSRLGQRLLAATAKEAPAMPMAEPVTTPASIPAPAEVATPVPA